jgi:hypothetical protein
MSFSLSEGNKFHKTRRCSHICHRFYYDLVIYALIKKNRLISDIAWLNQLDREKGLDHSKTYDIYDCSDVFYGIYFPQRGKNSLAICLPHHGDSRSFLVCSLRAMHDSFVSCCLLCQCPFLYTSFLMPWSDTVLI